MKMSERQLIIPDSELRFLEANVWSSKFVKAYLLNQGKREPIKLRYRGGHTREYPKRSYEIILKDRTVHLNAEYDDPSMIRNALSFQFFEWIGVPCSRTKFCHLMVNGRSSGVYLELEAVNRRFFARRKIPIQSLMYAVNDQANFGLLHPITGKPKQSLFKGYELQIGNQHDKVRLKTFIQKLNTLNNKTFLKYVTTRVDIDNYLRWLAGAVFTGNYDGFEQNYAIYEHKYRKVYSMVPWDYEGTWGRNCFGKLVSSNLVKVRGYNRLTKRLLEYPSIRSKYKAILREGLSQAFTTNKIMPVVSQMYELITPIMYQDERRKWSVFTFESEPLVIRNYIRERRSLITEAINQL